VGLWQQQLEVDTGLAEGQALVLQAGDVVGDEGPTDVHLEGGLGK
jgi:hypothetical protein